MDLEKNQMNPDNLYKEETFTDQSVGSIRPVSYTHLRAHET